MELKTLQEAELSMLLGEGGGWSPRGFPQKQYMRLSGLTVDVWRYRLRFRFSYKIYISDKCIYGMCLGKIFCIRCIMVFISWYPSYGEGGWKQTEVFSASRPKTFLFSIVPGVREEMMRKRRAWKPMPACSNHKKGDETPLCSIREFGYAVFSALNHFTVSRTVFFRGRKPIPSTASASLEL